MATVRSRPRATSSSSTTLSLRALNRATLARQLLLARAPLSVADALARTGPLQAQWPAPPHVGLWTRLAALRREEVAERAQDRSVVRATLLRGTLHLSTVADYLALRPTLQPLLADAFENLGERAAGIEAAQLSVEAAERLEGGPLPFGAIRDHLAARHPGLDARAMGYAVRTFLPLVQVPGEGAWGWPTDPSFALASRWLRRPVDGVEDRAALVRRYLATFGPATARDAQIWSGLTKLGSVFASLRPELVTFTDEAGRELFDLPDAPRPPEEVPAPPRLLPEFDTLLLAHHVRTRVIADAHKPRVFLSALRVAPTFLVDGFAAGTWKLARKKKQATLVLSPFAQVGKPTRAALTDEAEALARFMAPEATGFAVRLETA